MEKLTKRKNARSKGNVLLKSKRRNEEVAYILTDVKKLSSQRFSTNLFL